MCAAAVYILSLSLPAFAITISLSTFAIVYYFQCHKAFMRKLDIARTTEDAFFGLLAHLLEGFKEVKMNASRSDDLHQNYLSRNAAETAEARIDGGHIVAKLQILAQAFFYILIAALIFLLPSLTDISEETIIRLTAVNLFLAGPIINVLIAAPNLARANAAARGIDQLSETLHVGENGALDHPSAVRLSRISEVHELRGEGLTFSYRDEDGGPVFTMGPLDVRFGTGELTFLVGGNGSGKTTFLKVLAGLYRQERGRVRLNEVQIDEHNRPLYREFFSLITADVHLFDKLYGQADVDEEQVLALLERVGLAQKTTFVDGRFTNLELSTGQRKRLALVVALLEDRPVCLFDEVAADQDPQFRHFYYETLLPELREQGRTVLAVAHEDRFLEKGDRILRMDFGRFVQE